MSEKLLASREELRRKRIKEALAKSPNVGRPKNPKFSARRARHLKKLGHDTLSIAKVLGCSRRTVSRLLNKKKGIIE